MSKKGGLVYAIIVTYNGESWIRNCLESLKKSSRPVNSIVIDNGSHDKTLDIITENFPEISLIKSSNNLGFGQANNIGIKKAYDEGADYVFLLNQDASVEPETIEILVKMAERHPIYGILSPLHLNGTGDRLDWHFSNYIIPKRCPELYSDSLLEKKLKEVYNAEYVNAAAWLLSRNVIEKVGGFDPIFFHYGEDDNYMQRVVFHGFKIGVCPHCRIFHDREDRIKAPSNNSRWIRRKAMIKYSNVNVEGPVQ